MLRARWRRLGGVRRRGNRGRSLGGERRRSLRRRGVTDRRLSGGGLPFLRKKGYIGGYRVDIVIFEGLVEESLRMRCDFVVGNSSTERARPQSDDVRI